VEGVAHGHTADAQLAQCALDVDDHQMQPLHRPRRLLVPHEGDGAGRSRGGQLDHPELLAGPVVDIELEADVVGVEGRGPVDVRDRDDDVLELPVHAYTSEGTPKRS